MNNSHQKQRKANKQKSMGISSFAGKGRDTQYGLLSFSDFRITFASCGEVLGAQLAVADHLEDHWLHTTQTTPP